MVVPEAGSANHACAIGRRGDQPRRPRNGYVREDDGLLACRENLNERECTTRVSFREASQGRNFANPIINCNLAGDPLSLEGGLPVHCGLLLLDATSAHESEKQS